MAGVGNIAALGLACAAIVAEPSGIASNDNRRVIARGTHGRLHRLDALVHGGRGLGSRVRYVAPWLVLATSAACPPGDDVPVTSDTSTTGSSGSGSSGSSGTADSAGTSGSSGTTEAASGSEGGSESSSDGPEPACGNAVVEAEEACDDGGPSPTCDADCTPAECGDGRMNAAAGEACDDGGESAACDVDCTAPECGDGVLNVEAGELCDAGAATPLCDDDCTPVGCGDGVVNAAAGEACDDAGESAICNVDCSASMCGDGITNTSAGESCDDMGESLACDADCSPSSCGDGLVNAVAGEACDDAGETAACDADCTLATCGDAWVNAAAGEQCEGDDLAGATCQALGYLVGTLACAPTCAFDVGGCASLPAAPVLSLGFSPVKRFDFGWVAVAGASHYELHESPTPGDPFALLADDIVGTSLSLAMPLHLRRSASYRLRACNLAGCTDSAPVPVLDSLAGAVGYFKPSNTGGGDSFGTSVALSGDGNTLAVGASWESSSATGIDGNQNDDSAYAAGAVYVFVRSAAGVWSQQAYVKPSNTDPGDRFGHRVALSGDGSTLAISAPREDGGVAGIGGNPQDDSVLDAGAVHVFVRDGLGAWSQQAYVKASNTDEGDSFGFAVALSGDGSTLAVGATGEDSTAAGIGGDQVDDSGYEVGAAYVLVRDGLGAWSQQAYVKASNPGDGDQLGSSVALSVDGTTLALGARYESSSATGIDGNQASNTAGGAGAVYVLLRDGMGAWSQQAYVKASNTGANDLFGASVALSADGSVLAIGARWEDGSATGIGGNQASNAATDAGAVYVLTRSAMGAWSQRAYVKASNAAALDEFGEATALSADGDVLAVGASWEDSNATGIGGNQASNASGGSGAVYLY